jgi:hypothetical protein
LRYARHAWMWSAWIACDRFTGVNELVNRTPALDQLGAEFDVVVDLPLNTRVRWSSRSRIGCTPPAGSMIARRVYPRPAAVSTKHTEIVGPPVTQHCEHRTDGGLGVCSTRTLW